MNIYETPLTDAVLEKLIAMSEDWENENSCHGYRRNGREDIEPNRIFLAECDGEILGYLLGNETKAERTSSVIAENTPYFELEELYVVPSHRSEGVGRAIYQFVEEKLQGEGIEYIMLATATKDYKRILHFYIDELGMEFWNARLFKKL